MNNGNIKKYFFRFLLSSIFFILSISVHADTSKDSTELNQIFINLADEYIDKAYLPDNPSLATIAGIHSFDNKFEDYSKTGINRRLTTLKRYQVQFNAIDATQLNEQEKADRELILSHILSERLTLETIRPWENNPDFYSSSVASSAFSLIAHRFASPNDRLRSLIAREKQMSVFLKQAQINLKNPSKIYTEIALEQLPDIIKFFKNDLPTTLKNANDPSLIKQFNTSNAVVCHALQIYQAWLKNNVLTFSHGDFRLGVNTFRKKLLYDEMIDIPLDKLLAIGMINLKQNQAEFTRTAHEIDPYKSPMQVLKNLQSDHPPPGKLLYSFQNTFIKLIDFIQTKHIITIPSDVRPILIETPPYMRATMSVIIDTPGPFESKAKEAYFGVTLPKSTWSSIKKSDYMEQFNYPSINNITIHTAYPGHYIQFLWMHHIDDRIRKLFGANSNIEGWALYCEQMMLDEGFGQNNKNPSTRRNAKRLRLAQLHDALLRNARFIVSIKIHTGQMTINQGIHFFVKEAYQPYIVAIKEVKRSTIDPMYLTYTLGKLQILKLRNDLKTKEGAAFNLEQFHNHLMLQGSLPIKIVRKTMLHDDSPTL